MQVSVLIGVGEIVVDHTSNEYFHDPTLIFRVSGHNPMTTAVDIYSFGICALEVSGWLFLSVMLVPFTSLLLLGLGW